SFIGETDWRKDTGDGHYRVADKDIQPFNRDDLAAVVTTEKNKKEDVFEEVAQFVKGLKDRGKIEDYNQVAFLFPSLTYHGEKNGGVADFEEALNSRGIQVFAPRAGRFLDSPEAVDIF